MVASVAFKAHALKNFLVLLFPNVGLTQYNLI